MKKFLIGFAASALALTASTAFADDDVAEDQSNETEETVAPPPPAPVPPAFPATSPVCGPSDANCYNRNAPEGPGFVYREEPRFRFLGLGFSVGVPSGLALGVVGRIPKIHFLKLELDATYNGLAPGMKGGLTFDPIKFPIAPTLTAEMGGNWGGQVPGVDKSPTVSYQYENLLLGLEFGSRDAFRFYLRGGLTHINANVSNLQKALGNSDTSVTLGDIGLSAWAAPCAQLGFQWLF